MTQLEEFKNFVRDTNGLVVWSVGAGVFGALVANFAGVAPPWPRAATPITCAAMLIVLMYVFLVHRRIGRQAAKSRFVKSIALTFCSLIAYLFMYSLFVIIIPTDQSVIVSGFVCQKDAASIFENCPILGLDEMASANYDPNIIWTKLSISINRIAIFVIWIMIFSSFIYSAGVFVIYSRKKRA